MKPALRWVLSSVVVLAAIAGLSLYALRTSPVTPPLGAPTTDGGTTGGVDAGEARPGVTGGGLVIDSGTGGVVDGGTASALQPFPAGELREREVAFQIAILPIRTSLRRPVDTVQKIAKREFPQLRIVTRPDKDTPAPSLYVSEAKVDGISFQEITLFGRDLDHNSRVLLTRAKKALVLEFHLSPDASFEDLRRAHAIAHAVAAPVSAAIFDGETREYFSPAEWKLRRVSSWGEKLPQLPLQISIQASATPGGQRSVTFGMAKFGLPDVLIPEHPAHLRGPLATVINLVVQTLLERGELAREGRLVVDVETLQEPTIREEMKKLMRGNAAGETELVVGLSAPSERDPQNRLMELSFGDDPGVAQERTIRELFGP